MSIDLGFTKDPEWIKQREVLWEPRGKDLKSNFSKKEIADIKQYFMTGIVGNTYQEDAGKLGYFPVQSPEGWDFVLENMIGEPEFFRSSINQTFQDRSDVLFMAPYELAKWDYFLGETFESTITSRVPIAGEKVTLELDPHDVFCRYSTGVIDFIKRWDGGDLPKHIQRIGYYWSLWPYITDACFSEENSRSSSAKTIARIGVIFSQIIEFKPRVEFDDPNQTRPKFLKMMEEKLDELYPQLCPKLQALWDETKAKKAALAK